MDDEPDQSVTATADEELKDLVRKWEGAKKDLTMVTAGKPGVGKSTVINNLLGLEGDKAAEAKFGAESVTKIVDHYDGKKYRITVRIFDTPGLEAKDIGSEQEQKALATLSLLTKVDLMLYCISLVGGRIPKDDQRIVEKLTNTFGAEIWKHTILVLTHGDVVLQSTGPTTDEYRKTLNSFTEKFGVLLKNTGVHDVPVKSILNIGPDFIVSKPEIVGVPVGQRIEKPPDSWAPLLFKEIVKRCNIDAIPALLVLTGITPQSIDEVLKITEGVLEGVLEGVAVSLNVGNISAFLGIVVGGVLGGVAGSSAGGVGVIPGAAAGAEVGKKVGAAIGFVGGTAVIGIYKSMEAIAIAKEWKEIGNIIKAREEFHRKNK